MTREIWKDVPEYEGLYKVSNKGRVMSVGYGHKSLMTNFPNGGYSKVGLTKNKNLKIHFVHRLVLTAFSPNTNDETPLITHINGDKLDNRLNNLKWSSYSEVLKGSKGRPRSLSDSAAQEIINRIEAGESVQCVANDYDAHYQTILALWHGKTYANIERPSDTSLHKLSPADIRAIVKRRQRKDKIADIATDYGIHESYVSHIMAGRRHSDITDGLL